MAYIGNDLQVAYQSYQIIDDISGSFNGSTTSFALLVGGVPPVPFPINEQQCLISVGGVIQEPDPTGTNGFKFSGSSIVFSSAPGTGEDFFGVILAGADYVNVGVNYPSGSVSAPSITFDADLDTGIYNPAPNELGLVTNGTNHLNIDSSGQVEISSAGSAASPTLVFNTDIDTGIYSPGANQLAFATNGTEAARINSIGCLIVNDTDLRDLSGQKFQVSGFAQFYQTSSGVATISVTHTESATQSAIIFRQGNPASTVGSISVSGGSSTSYNTSSDYRLKENIVPLTGAADRIKQLKPNRFNFIANPDRTVDGFIAHEVQDIVPEAITGEKDAVDDKGNPEYQGIDQSKMVPLLTAALQEAIGRIETLEAEVAALKGA